MSTVTAIVVPLGTAAIASAAALSGVWFGGRHEKAQWLRAERRQAYVAFLHAADRYALKPGGGEQGEQQVDDLQRSAAVVELVGPDWIPEYAAALVHAAFDAYASMDPHSSASRMFDRARDDFVGQARAALTSGG